MRDTSGVPHPTDPVVLKHLRDRSQLMLEERRQRQDYEFRQSLSPTARRAHEIVAAIRKKEIEQYWQQVGTDENGDAETYPGMMFHKAKPIITSTKLWSIIRRMPKGAVLHSHMTAILSFRILFEILLGTEGMVVRASNDLSTASSRKAATITFGRINSMGTGTCDIYEATYIPDTPVSLQFAAANFPGGHDAFIEFLYSKTTITEEEAVRHDLGVNEIWRRFVSRSDQGVSAYMYEPVLRAFYQKLLEGMVDDGISWLETRSGGFSPLIVRQGEEVVDPDEDAFWQVMLEEVEKFKKTPKGKDFWGMRVIWADLRSEERDVIVKNMKSALARKQAFPSLFSGYDLVAQEDTNKALVDLAPELIWFQEQAEAMKLTMPFFFHAGQTLGDCNSSDDNLFDALLFDTRRIGHGFSMYKHPKLMEEVIKRKVMIEVCPISNEVLRLTTDVLHHPLPAMIAHGLPTSINCDDPAMLGHDTAGLSFDFYQVIQSFDSIGLVGLGALAHNSVLWANFEDQTKVDWIRDIELGENGSGLKSSRLHEWNEKWEEFCSWIVEEFGSSEYVKQ